MADPEGTRSVFIIDDDPAIRLSLSRALRLRGFEVETYESAEAFLAAYDNHRLACLVLDYGMPGMSGLELQKHLNDEGRQLPTIFITGHGGIPESVEAMKGGAIDFLEKPFRQSDLIERIHSALEMAADMQANSRALRETRERFERLTPREREIVDHILAHPAEVSSKEIGRHLDISPRTVDHHRARILEKLDVGSIVELIDLALRANR
ncbi:response regulator transcription factor [Paracoccus marinaquae]|uniref:Response regulator n=1 Tax=Paracoccus marinaquae TaxID=2841926 RepID=A0ABS6ALH6_9RHOB|nr:response regulator [Paracoccus marinaquae]MBU3030957.1 response regulator [Paracoccus marinaquae]